MHTAPLQPITYRTIIAYKRLKKGDKLLGIGIFSATAFYVIFGNKEMNMKIQKLDNHHLHML
ncbi:hypothetical protein AAW28_12690 [Lacticaseibacillus casei]|nr:hypothetical protein AAW28_12690 [Lacticaseibacillus casei]